jgi:hypothetical protein
MRCGSGSESADRDLGPTPRGVCDSACDSVFSIAWAPFCATRVTAKHPPRPEVLLRSKSLEGRSRGESAPAGSSFEARCLRQRAPQDEGRGNPPLAENPSLAVTQPGKAAALRSLTAPDALINRKFSLFINSICPLIGRIREDRHGMRLGTASWVTVYLRSQQRAGSRFAET